MSGHGRAVDPVRAAVKGAADRLGPGLYGIACSGGADSLALAHATIAVVGAAHVVVLTIDHQLQPGSRELAETVAAWARAQGASAVVEPVTVPRTASLEAAAREARYAALERLADRLGLAAIFLGHTSRDQAETVLMRIVRGTGPAGLAGMPAHRGRFVRPLLALPRAAIDAYVAAHGLPAWDDPMNEDRRLTRVRMRKDVLPALRAENPQLDAALLRLARGAAEWLEVIDALARPFATFPLDCRALARQPAAVRKRAVSLALEAAGREGAPPGPEGRTTAPGYTALHLDEIDRLITRPARGQVTLDVPGARLVRSYDQLRLALEVPDPAALRPPAGPYVLRAWQPGDRMRPARLKGRSRKLSDLYIDAKVPRDVRAHARVLVRTTDGAIVWAEHVGLAFGAAENLLPERA